MSVAEKTSMTGQEMVALSKQHSLYEWSAQAHVDPIPVARAKGVYFWTPEGKRFIDFNSQLMCVNIGHGDPRVIKAIQDQAATLAYANPFMATEPRARLGQKLAELSPGDIDVFFFTNGGAEANENAIRIARLATGRHKILARYRSYHGGTGAALTATGDPRRWAMEPGMPGILHVPHPHHGLQRGNDTGAAALAQLEEIIMLEGPQTIAGFILETVTGTNGIHVPPDGYLEGVRALCDKHGILMIADEVMSGFGRTGEWFAVDHWNVAPDLICFAKGINSGYVPLGGVVMSRRIADTFKERAYPGGLTYSGHPLACAAAVASITIFKEEGILEHARTLGSDVIGPALRDLQERHPSVGDVRGLGVFWAIELVRNRDTREPLVPYNAAGEAAAPMNEVVAACKAKGVWPFAHFNRIHVVPPCTISAEDVRHGIAVIDEALEIADRHYAG
jgi:taurine--2-oxoglutarate transaminase